MSEVMKLEVVIMCVVLKNLKLDMFDFFLLLWEINIRSGLFMKIILR